MWLIFVLVYSFVLTVDSLPLVSRKVSPFSPLFYTYQLTSKSQCAHLPEVRDKSGLVATNLNCHSFLSSLVWDPGGPTQADPQAVDIHNNGFLQQRLLRPKLVHVTNDTIMVWKSDEEEVKILCFGLTPLLHLDIYLFVLMFFYKVKKYSPYCCIEPMSSISKQSMFLL